MSEKMSKLGRSCSDAGMQDDRRRNIFSETSMRSCESRCLCDGRVTQQGHVNLDRRDLLTAPVDEVLDPSMHSKESFVVEASEIAHAKPTIDKGCPVELRIIQVTGRQGGSSNQDLPVLAWGHWKPCLADNDKGAGPRLAACSRFALARKG